MKKDRFVHQVFLLGMLSLSACVTPLQPLAPGTAHLENSTRGLVFGRIIILGDVCLQMSQSCGMAFGWWLKREESGDLFLVEKLTTTGPFVLSLPSGTYHVTGLMFLDCDYVRWRGEVPATFKVTAGKATYLGSWVIRFLPDGLTVRTQVIDHFAQASQGLASIYTGPPVPVTTALLQSSRDGDFGPDFRRD
jgi:hypothetical protein